MQLQQYYKHKIEEHHKEALEGGERADRAEKLSAEEQAKKMTERMTKTLDLSAKQSKEIYDINLKYATQRVEKAEAVKRERKEKKENIKKNADKRTEEIKSILNAEQKTEFEKMEQRDKKPGAKAPIRGRGGRAPQK